MKGEKVVTLANFNCVFEKSSEEDKKIKEEHPMLEYFTSIVYPSLKNDVEKEEKKQEKQEKEKDKTILFFLDTEVKENENSGLYVIGKIVKATTLEVETIFNEKENKLEEVGRKHEAAPYSTFIIFLKNHRMLFIPNQKGSPTISNFRKLIEKNMRIKIKNHNSNSKENIRIKNFNIFELPKKINLLNELKSFDKIKEFYLDIVPLNNDIYKNGLDDLEVIRKALGSDKAQQSFKNPTNLDKVADAINETNGQAEYGIIGRKNSGEKEKVYKNDSFSEKVIVLLPEHNSNEDNEIFLIDKVLGDERIKVLSDSNNDIYTKLYSALKGLIKGLLY